MIVSMPGREHEAVTAGVPTAVKRHDRSVEVNYPDGTRVFYYHNEAKALAELLSGPVFDPDVRVTRGVGQDAPAVPPLGWRQRKAAVAERRLEARLEAVREQRLERAYLEPDWR